MTRTRPSVFVGSSAEGLKIAKAVQILLDYSCEVTIWSQGVFGLSQGTLESLVQALDDFDFAVLVLTPDDLIVRRGESHSAARDNVVFELGLFMGSLGRDRTFAVFDRTSDLHLPSDLAGITLASYEPHSSGNLKSSLGAPCSLIEEAVEVNGIRTKEELKNLWKATDEVESAGSRMRQLIGLLARSRKVELDIIATQFGSLISAEHLRQMQADLEDIEKSLGDSEEATTATIDAASLAPVARKLLKLFSTTESSMAMDDIRKNNSFAESVAKLRYYLDALTEGGLLEVSYRDDKVKIYRLNRAGRSFVVENEIAS